MKKLLVSTILLSSVFANMAFAENKSQPYYFSNELKQAIQNCSPYSEDIFEKNPDMITRTEELLGMFFNAIDLSSIKMILSVNEKKDNKCNLSIRYDAEFPLLPEYTCSITQEDQNKLLKAMNNKTIDKITRKYTGEGYSMTLSGREFDLALNEILNDSCAITEHEASEKEMEILQKRLMAFPDSFKESLQKCEPNKTTMKIMDIDIQEAEIVGKEQEKCHIATSGFHILLDSQELNLNGFDELNQLLANEARATYNPAYKYKGILFALAECKDLKKMNKEKSDWSTGDSKISLGDNIEIIQGMKQSYTNGICKILINQTMSRNHNEKNYSLRCDVVDENIDKILNYYSNILNGNLPQISEHSYRGGKQTDEITAADKETFLHLYDDKICKSVDLYPATNSLGCSDSKPLRGGGFEEECYSCDNLETIEVKNRNECEEVCDGSHGRAKRELKHFNDCVLASCPANKPLKDSWGECHSCDFEGSLEAENCSLCPNRKVDGFNCVIADCSNRPLKDINGNCYACDTEKNVQVLEGQCTTVCPNRTENGGLSLGGNTVVYCEYTNEKESVSNENLSYIGGKRDTHTSLLKHGAECPEGYHWANKTEFENLKINGNFPSDGDSIGYWLQTCVYDDCTMPMGNGFAYIVNHDGRIVENDRGSFKLPSLCIQ